MQLHTVKLLGDYSNNPAYPVQYILSSQASVRNVVSCYGHSDDIRLTRDALVVRLTRAITQQGVSDSSQATIWEIKETLRVNEQGMQCHREILRFQSGL